MFGTEAHLSLTDPGQLVRRASVQQLAPQWVSPHLPHALGSFKEPSLSGAEGTMTRSRFEPAHLRAGVSSAFAQKVD